MVNIINSIIPHAGVLLAVDTLNKSYGERESIQPELRTLSTQLDAAWERMDRLEGEVLTQTERVYTAKAGFVRVNKQYNDAYKKVVKYWKDEVPGMTEAYYGAVREVLEAPKEQWDEVQAPVLYC